MIEIDENVWIGNQVDFENRIDGFSKGWSVVHACKETYHRKALGYTSRGAPKQHQEYFYALRGNELCLNLIDADNPSYIPSVIIDFTLSFIRNKLESGERVFIHCNQGFSRSPAIGLLYLATKGEYEGLTYDGAKKKYLEIYPMFSPAAGIDGYCRMNWEKYNG